MEGGGGFLSVSVVTANCVEAAVQAYSVRKKCVLVLQSIHFEKKGLFFTAEINCVCVGGKKMVISEK